jgi:transposase InsO family protein
LARVPGAQRAAGPHFSELPRRHVSLQLRLGCSARLNMRDFMRGLSGTLVCFVAPKIHRCREQLMASSRIPSLPLPKGWPEHLQEAFVHAVALARFALLQVRGWAVNSPLERARLRADNDRLRSEVAMLQRELELKDSRMARLPAERRPHYAPAERLAILTLRAARGWSTAKTARCFLVVPATIRLWLRRCDAEGPEALLRTPTPVNRFPDFVTGLVQELKAMLPSMGRRRIADVLARAGLHLSATTARRMLRAPLRAEPEHPDPETATTDCDTTASDTTASDNTDAEKTRSRSVVAWYPGHVWGCDLTALPIYGGFWLPWLPWSLLDSWPFCWWLLVVVDHYSRCIEHVAVFSGKPSAEDVCAALDDAVAKATGPPKYMITDQGVQFRQVYRSWCDKRRVKPRFGAVGKTASIAVVERVHRTIKSEGLRRILLPLRAEDMLVEVELVARWYNELRPHRRFDGATPAEIKANTVPATKRPRFETRASFAVTSELRAERGVVLELDVTYLEQRAHLPIVGLRPAA